ncbi:hypothetical protein [Shiella aurantiaca]|uniref:hypothetical protein n=1 Tax=Shiella aurantiaca TaxID=3058365 RepID=UPI0029F4C186|nr:hypothetical protein [Shiella aurantiaca]
MMQLLPTILIGLSSTFIFQGCIFFIGEPPNGKFLETYKNTSQEDIELVFIGKELTDTVRVLANSVFVMKRGFTHNDDMPVNEFVGDMYRTGGIVQLYSQGQLHKEWQGPPGNFGDSVNDPFNFDSWEVELYQAGEYENPKGTIIFTISDEDLQ